MRRGSIVMLVVVGAIVGLLATAVAVFIPWLPEQASTQREGIDFVFWLTTGICVGVFAVVAAVIVYSVLRFRARPDDDTDGPPIHGHTGLEIVWTAIPALLVIVIGVASAIVLARNERTGANPLRIDVTARQFAWSFEYPNGLTSGTLRLPVDRTVVLRLTANDVIHSFWVPQFGQKQDAVPGIFTELVITPKTIGEFPVICTELCGLGHSVMRTAAVVLEEGEYDSWLAAGGTKLAGPPGEAGAAVFEEQGCGACHTFEPAGASGTTGPSLDELEDDPAYVRESILDPNAQIAEGFGPNVMPPFKLPADQLDALVQYLVSAGGGD
ncbi:MAG: cytochrome c oxidase subunit II [Gaiellaceae bacterium]